MNEIFLFLYIKSNNILIVVTPKVYLKVTLYIVHCTVKPLINSSDVFVMKGFTVTPLGTIK